MGTAPALDPLSLFLGWKAGNWVARQRGKKSVEEETSETVVIEWDGDNTDLEYLEAGTTPYWYYAPMYKVSDQTPTLEQLQNAKMVLGETDDATASETYLMTESPGFTIADINDAGYLLVIGLAMTSTNYMSYVVVIRNEEFAEYLGVSTGTYFLRVEGGYYTMKLEYPVTVE